MESTLPPPPAPSTPPLGDGAGIRPAPVLAGVGTFLLAAAAVSFVSARWDRFGPGDRLGVLVVASAAVFAAALALRRLAPATARALDVLVAALVPVDVAALTIVGGAAWPVVLSAAGSALVIAAEVLRRRDPSVVAEFGTVVGGVLAACGFAAAAGVAMAPLLAALGLCGCVAAPWRRDRIAGPVWAAVAGLAPALRVLDDVAFTGDGTLRRLGLLDATTWRATLLAGGIGVVALGWAARTRRGLLLWLTAAAVVLATAAALWAEHQPPRSLLVVAAAIVIALAELALTGHGPRQLPVWHTAAAGVVASINAALTTVVAALAAGALVPESEVVGPEWAYAGAVLAFAWIVVDVRRAGERGGGVRRGGGWAPATWGAAAALLAALVVALSFTVAALVALGLASLLLASDRAGRRSLAWVVGVGAPLVLVDDWRLAVVGAVVGGLLVALAALEVHRRVDPALGAQLVFGANVPAAAALVAVWPHRPAVAGLVALGLLWMVALVTDGPLPNPALALRTVGLVAAISLAPADPTFAGLGLLGAAVAWLAHGAATRRRSSAVLASWSLVVAVALLGLDVATEPAVVLAFVVGGVGAALTGFGLDDDSEAALVLGGFLVWWASLVGLAGSGVTILEPYVHPVLGMLAWAMTRAATTPPARWWVVVVPLAGAGAVGFGQRIADGHAWHTLLLGVIALGVATRGAHRRRRPELVAGAALTVAVGAFEALDRVVGIESWSWMVVAGAVALTVAALLEATGRDEPTTA